jgi:thiol-disulfide isomerase/thioredoxin
MTKTTGANPYTSSTPAPKGESKLPWILGAAVVGIVVIIGLAVLLWPSEENGAGAGAGTGAEAAKNATQENAAVTISGEDLPALPDTGQLLPAAGEDPGVGLAAPKLVGQSFDESEVVIDPSDGKPKMVVFLAHWCPHCQAEVPLLQEWIASGDVPEGLEIYAVSTGVDSSQPNYPPSNWIASEGWEPQILLDDEAQTAAKSWGLTGFPYIVMLDAEGDVWQRGTGEIPVEDIQRLADELVAGQGSTGGTGADDGLSSDFDAGATTLPTSAPATTAVGG